MKRVLLTGGSGFIGKQCLSLLVAKGYEVHALARKLPAWTAAPTGASEVFWHELDLLYPGGPTEAIKRIAPEYLLHLAWYAVPGKFWDAPENREWVRASLELFDAFRARGGERLVAAGSCAEYASRAGECSEDRTPLAPTALYGCSKHELQQKLDAWSKQVGVSAAWGRIFHLYGPHEDPSRLVAYAIRSLLRSPGSILSFASGSAIKRITAGVKAAADRRCQVSI